MLYRKQALSALQALGASAAPYKDTEDIPVFDNESKKPAHITTRAARNASYLEAKGWGIYAIILDKSRGTDTYLCLDAEMAQQIKQNRKEDRKPLTGVCYPTASGHLAMAYEFKDTLELGVVEVVPADGVLTRVYDDNPD